MMLIPEELHANVVSALRDLQSRGSNLSDLARELDVKTSWLHLLKQNGVGAETVRKIILLNNHFVKNHPDLLDSANAQADEPVVPNGNNDDKTTTTSGHRGAAVALCGAGNSGSDLYDSSTGAGV